MARINLFNPFSSPEYENRLTWAFLVAFKYAPLFQKLIRELVESNLPPGDREHGNIWESARVSTQMKRVDSPPSRLVSVLLTDETIGHIPVEWSDRDPVYDGVIEYPDGLTLIIENKLSHADVWREQLCPSRISFSSEHISDIFLHDSAICLEWSNILEEVLKYTDSGMDSFANREIFKDFLSFVEENHPGLTPYRTFRLSGNREQALDRRTRLLVDKLGDLSKLESHDGWYLFRPDKIAERIGIWADTVSTLDVKLWPAATVNQARRFYKEVNKTALLGLDDWKVEPNLRFSFIQRPLIDAKTTWPTDRYFDYFADRQSSYGQMDEATLVPLAKQWENEGLIASDDLQKLQDQFNSTNRKTLNVIPGFTVSRTWNLNEVIDLEEQGRLEECIIEALSTPLSSWGETLFN
ncbi:MAG: hypothetical protein OXG54_07900 [Gammaproteobacteria bacterium]|nr:hypothetical protein [Gammaproteobacteria bacterium]